MWESVTLYTMGVSNEPSPKAEPPDAWCGPGPSELHGFRLRLATGREHIRRFHETGASGEQLCDALTSLCDGIVGDLYDQQLAALPAGHSTYLQRAMVLVATGGYGRGELAAFSDLDLLFLVNRRDDPVVGGFVSELIRNLWDCGFAVAQSVRTPAECADLAARDLTVRTSLMTVRRLRGSKGLLGELQRRIRGLVAGCRIDTMIQELLAQRAAEHHDYCAPTALLLEPNVKKSPGGLRDLHLLQWVGAARYGTSYPQRLAEAGVLATRDAEHLRAARGFLLQLRHELHLHAGSAQDVLTREEQVRLAMQRGYETHAGVLGVEQFMRDCYRHTSGVHSVVTQFMEVARPQSRLTRLRDRLLSVRLEGGLIVGRTELRAESPERLPPDAERLLQVFDTARHYGVEIEARTLQWLCAAGAGIEITGGARRQFLAMLARPQGLGGLLRQLDRAGLLSALLPAFERVRGLIQFNLYHCYTVDEHTLRMLEGTIRRAEDAGLTGQAYRLIGRKDLLHLAVLLHDLGKGLQEDHCVAGRRLAMETAAAFGLDEHERELLEFLVGEHLLMANTAFRRDVGDERTLVQFARQVGTPETLRMLYVLTAADTEAVAPGNLSAWKTSLLDELYLRAMEELVCESPMPDAATRAEAARHKVRTLLVPGLPPEWVDAQLNLMPPTFMLTTEPRRVEEDLRSLHGMQAGAIVVRSGYESGTGVSTIRVLTREEVAPGILHKIAGALASLRIRVLNARILTRSDGLVIDTFEAIDPDFAGEPPESRREEIADRIQRVLRGELGLEDLVRRAGLGSAPGGGEARVRVDNDSAERFTILEVFADDRPGLLYTLTRTLFEHGLSVHAARISTHIDQAVDVFYISDASGARLTDGARLLAIRRALSDAVAGPGRAPESL